MKALVFLLVLTIPSASAGWGATVEGGAYQYPVDTFNFARDNPPTGDLFTRQITVTDNLDFPIAAREMSLSIGYSLSTSTNSAGIWRWTVQWDGIAIPNCFWEDETPSIVGVGIRNQAFTIVNCELTNAQSLPGSHNLTITRATASGSPAAVQHEYLSYRLTKHDFLEANMTNDLLEAATVLGAIITALVFTIMAHREEYDIPAVLLHIAAVLAASAYAITPGAGFESLRIYAVILALYNAAQVGLIALEHRNSILQEN